MPCPRRNERWRRVPLPTVLPKSLMFVIPALPKACPPGRTARAAHGSSVAFFVAGAARAEGSSVLLPPGEVLPRSVTGTRATPRRQSPALFHPAFRLKRPRVAGTRQTRVPTGPVQRLRDVRPGGGTHQWGQDRLPR